MRTRSLSISRVVLSVVAVAVPTALSAAGEAASGKAGETTAKYASALATGDHQEVQKLLAAGIKRAPGEELDGLAGALVKAPEEALPVIESLLDRGASIDPAAAADLLWRIAQKDRLTDELASIAGELLGHEDPFVRALAEWAIATKVGRENGRQEIAWPRPDPP